MSQQDEVDVAAADLAFEQSFPAHATSGGADETTNLPTEGKLAHGESWEQVADAEGRMYFWNRDTNETQWQPPGEPKIPSTQVLPRGILPKRAKSMDIHTVDWEELERFLPTGRDPDSKKARKKLWKQIDGNGNGLLSRNEIRNHLDFVNLTSCLPKAVVMRAFDFAKAFGDDDDDGGKGGSDDFVEFVEFRVLLLHIHWFLQLFILWDKLPKEHPKRLTKAEFCSEAALSLMREEGVLCDDPEWQFKKIDDDGSGIMVYQEFACWAICFKSEAPYIPPTPAPPVRLSHKAELSSTMQQAMSARKSKKKKSPRKQGMSGKMTCGTCRFTWNRPKSESGNPVCPKCLSTLAREDMTLSPEPFKFTLRGDDNPFYSPPQDRNRHKNRKFDFDDTKFDLPPLLNLGQVMANKKGGRSMSARRVGERAGEKLDGAYAPYKQNFGWKTTKHKTRAEREELAKKKRKKKRIKEWKYEEEVRKEWDDFEKMKEEEAEKLKKISIRKEALETANQYDHLPGPVKHAQQTAIRMRKRTEDEKKQKDNEEKRLSDLVVSFRQNKADLLKKWQETKATEKEKKEIEDTHIKEIKKEETKQIVLRAKMQCLLADKKRQEKADAKKRQKEADKEAKKVQREREAKAVAPFVAAMTEHRKTHLQFLVAENEKRKKLELLHQLEDEAEENRYALASPHLLAKAKQAAAKAAELRQEITKIDNKPPPMGKIVLPEGAKKWSSPRRVKLTEQQAIKKKEMEELEMLAKKKKDKLDMGLSPRRGKSQATSPKSKSVKVAKPPSKPKGSAASPKVRQATKKERVSTQKQDQGKGQTPPSSGPEAWKGGTDTRTGKPFYYNTESKQTVWDRPQDLSLTWQPTGERSVADLLKGEDYYSTPVTVVTETNPEMLNETNWVVGKDPVSTHFFYLNIKTTKLQWKRPAWLPAGFEAGYEATQQAAAAAASLPPPSENDLPQEGEIAPTLSYAEAIAKCGWKREIDPSSRLPFFTDLSTSETQWEAPAALASLSNDYQWEAHFSPEQQRTFFHNRHTGQTTWVRPQV